MIYKRDHKVGAKDILFSDSHLTKIGEERATLTV